MTEKKKPEIIFAPGCFDNFEGTQEELDELLAEIHRMFESGEFLEKSQPMTEESFDELDEETQMKLAETVGLLVDEESIETLQPSSRKLH
jgi:hypothetical protein